MWILSSCHWNCDCWITEYEACIGKNPHLVPTCLDIYAKYRQDLQYSTALALQFTNTCITIWTYCARPRRRYPRLLPPTISLYSHQHIFPLPAKPPQLKIRQKTDNGCSPVFMPLYRSASACSAIFKPPRRTVSLRWIFPSASHCASSLRAAGYLVTSVSADREHEYDNTSAYVWLRTYSLT